MQPVIGENQTMQTVYCSYDVQYFPHDGAMFGFGNIMILGWLYGVSGDLS